MRFRKLKEEPLWKLKRERRNWRLVHIILPKALLAILAGILIGLLILGITEPREAAAETAPEIQMDDVKDPFDLKIAEMVPEATSEPKTETVQETAVETELEMEYLGTFTLTAYCNCRKCCGKWAGGSTASGAMPEAGRTIAVDKSVIPLGTQVYIEGFGYFTAEDTGSAIVGARIDVYMDSNEEARWFADGAGSCKAEVYIIK